MWEGVQVADKDEDFCAVNIHMLIKMVRDRVFPTVEDECRQLAKRTIEDRVYPMQMEGETDDAYIRRQAIAWKRLTQKESEPAKEATSEKVTVDEARSPPHMQSGEEEAWVERQSDEEAPKRLEVMMLRVGDDPELEA